MHSLPTWGSQSSLTSIQHTTTEPLSSNLEHTLKYLAHSGAPITLGPSDRSLTEPLAPPSFSLLFVTPQQTSSTWARNKITNQLKLDVGHVAWTSINPVSLSARPHPITTYSKTINIYMLVTFCTDNALATNLKSKTWHHRAHEGATKDASHIINQQLKTISRWLEQFALVTNNMIHFI